MAIESELRLVLSDCRMQMLRIVKPQQAKAAIAVLTLDYPGMRLDC